MKDLSINIQYSKFKAISILTMLSMMGLLASDIYLPAMPSMSSYFQVNSVRLQQTIGIFLFGLAVFQLIYGPLSDQIGRKKIIITGVCFYIIGSLGSAFAHSIYILLFFRLIQAIGACSGLVLGRTIIADIFPQNKITNVYNIIYPLVAASPAIAPIIGGYLVSYFSWKASFIFVGTFGLLLLFLMRDLPETLQKEQKKFSISSIFYDYFVIIKNLRFWGLTVIVFSVYGAWFIYLTQSPFIFINTLHYSSREVGFFYIPLAISIYIGNILSKKLKSSYGIEVSLTVGCLFFLSGAVLLFIIPLLKYISNALQLIIPMSLLAISNGFILPLGIPAAISLNPDRSGSGSGLIGFFQIFFSALCASFIGEVFGVGIYVMSGSILFLSIASCIFYWYSKIISKQQLSL
ncbi:MAG: Bcr/CflA family efflux MFS transporter [Proteobacteria bacterium]|nr:MAG: Bcr/CflA family efflux MFS transporter [Pseudomonadota bacterium]